MKIEVETTVDRPLYDVWDFCVVHHAENHPRWDPDIELELSTVGPVGVGSVFRRRNKRFDPPVDGTMEVTDLSPGRLMRVVIREGATTTPGWMAFASLRDDVTVLTRGADFPLADVATGGAVRQLMVSAGERIKHLIEAG